MTSNAPLRGEKGSLYQRRHSSPCPRALAGHRPGRRRVGHARDHNGHLSDADGSRRRTVTADATLDGLSIVPVLRNTRSAISRDALCWHLPHYHHSTPASAIRRGEWKLIEFFEDDRVELYNLRDDPAERRNLATAHPQTARNLRADLSRWRRQVGAQMPKPNPAYDPARANELAGRGRGERSVR